MKPAILREFGDSVLLETPLLLCSTTCVHAVFLWFHAERTQSDKHPYGLTAETDFEGIAPGLWPDDGS